jgi:small subunit ribosomal protein S1
MAEEMKSELAEVQNLEVGDVVTGKVVKVEDNQALVDTGYKFESILPISELSSLHVDKVSDVLSEGDEVTVKVLRIKEDEGKLIVSKKEVDAEKAWAELQQKFETGETLTAKVHDIVKGGLVVDVGVRGFIPASHVEQHFVEDFSDYKGRELTLKVVELDPEKNKLILSHKAVLEEEQERRKKERLSQLEEGQVLEGTVQRLTDFGAFVDIGGVDGLVHVSEIAWHRCVEGRRQGAGESPESQPGRRKNQPQHQRNPGKPLGKGGQRNQRRGHCERKSETPRLVWCVC